jgi:hypothetical protein
MSILKIMWATVKQIMRRYNAIYSNFIFYLKAENNEVLV